MKQPDGSPAYWKGTPCILWEGLLNDAGYGIVWISGQRYRVHRLAWEEVNGPIPDGLTIDHLCRNRACYNHLHLETVSLVENVMRGESIPAKHARQTHCLRGHLLFGDNVYRPPKRPTARHCKTCQRERNRRARCVNR